MGRPKGSPNKPENAKNWTFRALLFDEVVEIRRRCMAGEPLLTVGRDYGMQNTTSVRIIVDSKDWNGTPLPAFTAYSPPQNPTDDGVEYREVPNRPGYKVGNDGSIWCCIGGKSKNPVPWKRISPTDNGRGYLSVTLGTGKNRHYLVHRLMANIFLGPKPQGMVCRHLDGDMTNNRTSNLAWGTVQDNIDDRTRHGTQSRAKLNEKMVLEARQRQAKGESVKDLSLFFGLSMNAMHKAISGKTWKDVPLG